MLIQALLEERKRIIDVKEMQQYSILPIIWGRINRESDCFKKINLEILL